jgi:hypothetical protein
MVKEMPDSREWSSQMSRFKVARLSVALALMVASGTASAFRSTDVESYTDPDYKDFQPRKVMLVVENSSQELRSEIEERFAKALVKKGVEVIPQRKIFPPTRDYTPEERASALQSASVDSALVVTIGASASSVMAIATQTRGTTQMSATPNSRGGFNATGNTNSTSQNIYAAKSKSEFSAVLFDVGQNRTAWYADVQVKASGTLFVGEKGDAKGLVGAVIEALENDGHVAK